MTNWREAQLHTREEALEAALREILEWKVEISADLRQHTNPEPLFARAEDALSGSAPTLDSRVTELERERDDAVAQLLVARSEHAEAAQALRTERARVAELEAALREARDALERLTYLYESEQDTEALEQVGRPDWLRAVLSGTTSTLDALIADAVRAEREACARLCDPNTHDYAMGAGAEPEDCAAAIRARGGDEASGVSPISPDLMAMLREARSSIRALHDLADRLMGDSDIDDDPDVETMGKAFELTQRIDAMLAKDTSAHKSLVSVAQAEREACLKACRDAVFDGQDCSEEEHRIIVRTMREVEHAIRARSEGVPFTDIDELIKTEREECLKSVLHQSRRVRDYRNPDQVYEAVPVAILQEEVSTSSDTKEKA